MIIRRLTASFGKLDNESISFHDGLNVVSMPNESGKSTWCAFIKSMLYGIDSSERAKTGYIPDKQKYSPWSGAVMEGSMDLSYGSKDITVTRTTVSKNAPMREFSACYTGTNQKIPDLNASNAGEVLAGVSKEVFLRSAYVEQGSPAVTGNAELEKRILSLYSSGEEDVSYEEAGDRLRSWQRKRRYNRKGFLPELESGIDAKEADLKEIEDYVSDISILEEQERQYQNEINSLEKDVTQARREYKEKLISEIGEARNDLKYRSQIQNEALNNLNSAKEELRNSPLGVKKETETLAEASKDIEEARKLENQTLKSINLILSIILFVIAAAGAFLYEQYFRYLAVIITAAALCVGAIILLAFYLKKRKAVLLNREKLSVIFQKYGTDSIEGINTSVADHTKLCRKALDVMDAYKKASDSYDDAAERLSILERKVIQETDESDASVLSRQLGEARSNQMNCSLKIASKKGEMLNLGDPLVVRTEIETLRDEYERIENEYDAISLALDVLKESDDEMQQRFSPELGRLAAEYMKQMTGGKYEEILLNRDFSAMAKTADDTVARKSEYLSAGTADLLYLAIRLAICDLALPEGENCPLIIDDALVNLDEERYKQAIDLLLKIAKKRQVILFTCRKA